MKSNPTCMLAGEPDKDCTLTPHFSGSNLNASSALFCNTMKQSRCCSESYEPCKERLGHDIALDHALAEDVCTTGFQSQAAMQ